MPLQKKQKVAIGLSVGIIVVLAAVGVTIYFVTKSPASSSKPSPTPDPSTVTWTCVDDGQNKSMLLANSKPCAKYDSNTLCQAAATAGTVDCSCPSGQVLYGSACANICLGGAAWNNNQCTCPSGTQYNSNTQNCDTVCSPPLAIDETTGKVSGFFVQNGSCVDSSTVTSNVAYLNTTCQNTPCDLTSCSPGSKFVGFDSSTHTCVPPNQCNGQSFFYTWPDGSNTCPGFTYNLKGTSCAAPDALAIQTACEYSAGGCGAGTVPIGPGEQCATSGNCRPAVDTPTCPAGSTVNAAQCSSSSKGICYNSSTNQCGPAQYNCQPSQLPCPTGTTSSTSCPAITPCADSAGNCVATLVGCRPDNASWSFDTQLQVCSNKTDTTGLALEVANTSTTDQITVTATLPATYTVPLESLQFQYVLLGSAGLHWSGVVSLANPNPNNPKQTLLTIYPDQTITPVPASVSLSLLVLGMVQQNDGSWSPSISSAPLNSSSVTTCTLQAAPPSCLPLVGFNVSKALELVSQLNNMPTNVANTVAVTQAANNLGLNNASTKPLVVRNASTFAGAIAPVATIPPGTTTVNQMFVVLSWAVLPSKVPVTYMVSKNNNNIYTGPLTSLVDVVNVDSTTATTFSLQAQTSSTCSSPVQNTTCPPLEFSGPQCTSIVNGSNSLINFMIPAPAPGSGCIAIPSGNEQDAAYYACAYLRNGGPGVNNKTLEGLQVPNSGKTECVSIVPVTSPVVVLPSMPSLNDETGRPTGYCQGVDCTQGYLQTQRSAVCGCSGDSTMCTNQANTTPINLPYVSLSNGESMSANDFSSGLNGMANFLKQNKKLLF